MLLYLPAIRRVKSLMKPLDFRQDGRFFYRIVNDVTQQFCLVRFSPRSYTIRFRVGSVYDEEAHRNREGEDIGRVINGTNAFLSDEFWMTSYLRQQEPTEVCAEALEQYLLPWLENAADSESAWRAAKEAGLFLQLPGNRWQMEKYCYNNLGFFLGMGDWSAAEELLEYYIIHSEQYNQVWWKTQEESCKKLYRALKEKDAAYVRTYMEENRAKTYREFRWK